MRRRPWPADTPEFPEELQWLNTPGPLRLRDLRGKVVLLSFWASCCINCTHVIADLRRLLECHAPELVVIGVHSPRFAAEREIETLRAAVLRHQIDYPVINDRDMRVWRRFGVRAWPTIVLIGPDGRVLERRVGEAVFAAFDEALSTAIRDADRSGGLNHHPLELQPECDRRVAGALSFPAGILADERGGRLFISDTNNNRVVITDLDGRVLDVAGAGHAGLADGSFDEATFNRPHGLALDGTVLYVADRANHSIRRLELDGRTVRRVAGTGRQAQAMIQPGSALKLSLNSPWDLELVHHRIYITMAGAHQIWRMDVISGEMEPYAGAGLAGLRDGTRGSCLLAQPSGLTTDGVRLFFIDTGSSSVRWVYLPPGVQVGTWVGRGIFEHGDRDGPGRDALLQHPLGLTHHDGDLYLADTYNHRIKCLNPRVSRVTTLLGTGRPGHEDGERARFNEPRAISYADGRLWIADTNNHAIRVAPVDGGPVTTLRLHPLERLTARSS